MSSTSLRESGVGLGAAADEPGDAGRVAHDVPGVVVEAHAHEQVAREDLLLHDDLAAVLELDDVFHRDDDLEDAVLDVHRAHAAREVRLHLVLVAGVGVHDVPAAGRSYGLGSALGDLVVVDRPRRRAARRRSTIARRRPRRRRCSTAPRPPRPRRRPSARRLGRVGRRRRSSASASATASASSTRSSDGRSSSESRRDGVGHQPKMKSTSFDGEAVEAEDQRGHHDDADDHDDRRVDDLGAVGQATFFISALHLAAVLTRPGPLRLRVRRLRGAARARAACRRPAWPSVAWSVGSYESPRCLRAWALRSRAGGTRTPNRRFWRPVLCQLSYCPPGAGAGPTQDSSGPRATPGACAGTGRQLASGGRRARRRDRAISRAAVAPAATAVPPIAPAYASRRPDERACGIAPRSAASVSAASVSPSRPGVGST